MIIEMIKPILIYISAIVLVLLFVFGCSAQKQKEVISAKEVLIRTIGPEKSNLFDFKIIKKSGSNDSYSIVVKNGKIEIIANNQVALCRGAYDYLRNACNSIISWSGNRINIPDTLPGYSNNVTTPYRYRYYMNVVTNGYTTAYWDWNRWEKEIDWMAIHGINMPLLGGAHEAILYRVFQKLRLTDEEIETYFSGPAYFPWNRMGNLAGWDGPLPKDFFEKQIKLNHQILKRLKELGMHPIIPAFAGFVPAGIQRIYPDEKLRDVQWGGGLDKKYQSHILSPGSELFVKIGNLYIREWEKEFGKAEFYLADSFNEMDVPLSTDSVSSAKELASFGNAVFSSIHQANPDAIWVIQGWTFPFHKDKDGKLFWTPFRLNAFVSGVPDDKLLVLDLANEYNRLWWKIDPSWKMYDGFFNKQWIYSFVPNMGGKIPLNGRLDLYASMPAEALQYENKKNLVGFGFAPEGIENNEIIYELLSDVGWSDKAIDLSTWIAEYCNDRYGAFPVEMKESFGYLNKSCYGSFTDHPRFRYQLHPNINFKSLVFDFQSEVHSSEDFRKGVEKFLQCKGTFESNKLYTYDAIELTTQYLGLKADELMNSFRENPKKNKALLNEGLDILYTIDRLLESHPNYRLQKWVDFARGFGDTEADKNYYEANAKRLITTWGSGFGILDDYAARTWSGLIGDYYAQRWKFYYNAPEKTRDKDLLEWEENWIKTPWISKSVAFENPMQNLVLLFEKYNSELKVNISPKQDLP